MTIPLVDILLSLVRTRSVGHLRDVRRLTVAMSRARLGLYVFGRVALFQKCPELEPVFARLTARPTVLTLVKEETYRDGTQRTVSDTKRPKQLYELTGGVTELGQLVYEMGQDILRSGMIPVDDEPPVVADLPMDVDDDGENKCVQEDEDE